jgi:multisubunit Na+/H+ antiporter MnhE subunit
MGVGLTFAPVIGSFLHRIGGYSTPFIFYGVIFLFAAIFLKKLVPSNVDEKTIENEGVKK